MMKYFYYTNCVNWPRSKVDDICDCVDNAIDITRKTFLNHVDRDSQRDIKLSLGYAEHWKRGLTAAADWSVKYMRSKLKGTRVYIFVQSGIEYVFVPAEKERLLYD